jgi:hypothetical protein
MHLLQQQVAEVRSIKWLEVRVNEIPTVCVHGQNQYGA